MELKKARRGIGEFEFPMTGLSGRVGTPTEIADIFARKSATQVESAMKMNMKQWEFISETIMQKSAPGNTIFRMAEATQATARTLMSGLDLGVYFIHLLPLLATRPNLWGKVLNKSMQAMIGGTPEIKVGQKGFKAAFHRKNVLAQYTDDNWDDITEMYRYNLLHGSASDFIEGARKQGLLRRFAGAQPKVPSFVPKLGGKQFQPFAGTLKGFEKVLEGVERNFESALTMSKVELWKALKPMALNRGLDDDEALRRLAATINKMTGTVSMADIGLRPNTKQLLGGFLMFAPRYRLATYGLMKDIFRGNIEGSLARDTMGKLIGAGVLFYSYIGHHLSKLEGDDKQAPNIDPTSGKFLSYRIGNTNVGIGSAFVSATRFMGKFTFDLLEDPKAAFSIDEHDNSLQRFVRGQLAPLTGSGWDMIEGRDYIGEPSREDSMQVFNTMVSENVMPFWLSGMLLDEPKAGAIAPPSEFLGMRSMPVSKWERFVMHFNIKSEKDLGQSWDELDKLKRSKIMKKYPELQEIQDESYELNALRERREDVADYRAELRQLKDTYDMKLQEITKYFQTPDGIRGKEFRQRRSELGSAFALSYEMLEEEFEEVITELRENAQNPRAHVEDIAYDLYVEQVVAGNFYNEEDGEFDFSAKKRAQELFREEYGDATYAYIQQRLLRDNYLLQELDLGREAISPYWEVGRIILQRMDQQDLIPHYTKYLNSRKDVREDMELIYPIFKEVKSAQTKARKIMRQNNAELEKFLFRWDYIDTFINPDNVDLDPKVVKAEPIWFTVPKYEDG